MKRIALFLLVVLSSLLAAGGALAKGPIEATIDGPGLGSPIQVGDWDDFGKEDALASHQPIMQLAEAAGFFPATFGGPSVMLLSRPAGDLGPRYDVEYRVPGPDNDEFRISQDLYPYADPSPLTYTEPGQTIFERPHGTAGGWYVADDLSLPQLLPVLVNAGLPESDPTVPGATASAFPSATVGAAAAAAVLLGLGVLGVVLVRRRPHAAA